MTSSPTSRLTVRDARPDDAEAIAHSNIAMAFETEGKRLLPDVVTAGVRRLLADPALGFYLVAESGSELAGCLMVTTEWSDWRNGQFWWIQSVYVQPACRRRGVFSALYAQVGERAAARPGICGFRLNVEQHNTSAQQTYRALGMVETDYRVMEWLRPGIVFTRDD
jgi:ribosomal protein S18 acetylase RimI-like enzyme